MRGNGKEAPTSAQLRAVESIMRLADTYAMATRDRCMAVGDAELPFITAQASARHWLYDAIEALATDAARLDWLSYHHPKAVQSYILGDRQHFSSIRDAIDAGMQAPSPKSRP
jgi:hypothetical protein